MADLNGAPSPQQDDLMFQLAYSRALEMAQFQAGFLARTAHELRSPLNKAISLHQMILEGLCDDPQEEQEFVAEAQAASLKLLEYLDFLIRISKIEVGRVVPTLQAVSVADILEEVKAMTYLQATDRNLRLQVELPDNNVQVWADPTWLRNALTILVEIAIDSCDRGTIHLAYDADSPLEACHIIMTDDRPAEAWQEPIGLSAVGDFDLEDKLSSSLRMGVVKTMLQTMKGTLTLLSAPDSQEHQPTRLQIALPRHVQR
ncbi:MAG: HAMP domain-containing sensor histidine kinase [Cyanobacteria bacterium P01_H01_bin.58]